jgi:hypothetical protein
VQSFTDFLTALIGSGVLAGAVFFIWRNPIYAAISGVACFGAIFVIGYFVSSSFPIAGVLVFPVALGFGLALKILHFDAQANGPRSLYRLTDDLQVSRAVVRKWLNVFAVVMSVIGIALAWHTLAAVK